MTNDCIGVSFLSLSKKKIKKSCQSIRKPQCECCIFALDLKSITTLGFGSAKLKRAQLCSRLAPQLQQQLRQEVSCIETGPVFSAMNSVQRLHCEPAFARDSSNPDLALLSLKRSLAAGFRTHTPRTRGIQYMNEDTQRRILIPNDSLTY